jgi:hypothetical protein
MANRQHLVQLIQHHQRRLEKLELQQATYGLDTPPHVAIEIENISTKIGELETTLAQFDNDALIITSQRIALSVEQAPAHKKPVIISLNEPFDGITSERQQAAIVAFAAVMGITPQDIQVNAIYAGSIVFDLSVPRKGLERFHTLLQANALQLHQLHVEHVVLEFAPNQVEIWSNRSGIFQREPMLLETPSFTTIRAELEHLVITDLLGPAGGPEEEITERSVRDRYLVGMLAPRQQQIAPEEQDDLLQSGEDAPDDGPIDVSASQSPTMFPSSFGMTFCVEASATALQITASWGCYHRTKSAT